MVCLFGGLLHGQTWASSCDGGTVVGLDKRRFRHGQARGESARWRLGAMQRNDDDDYSY